MSPLHLLLKVLTLITVIAACNFFFHFVYLFFLLFVSVKDLCPSWESGHLADTRKWTKLLTGKLLCFGARMGKENTFVHRRSLDAPTRHNCPTINIVTTFCVAKTRFSLVKHPFFSHLMAKKVMILFLDL